jgi:hypothetical protein
VATIIAIANDRAKFALRDEGVGKPSWVMETV